MLEAMFITDTDNKLFLANIPIITSVNIMRPFFIGSTYDEREKNGFRSSQNAKKIQNKKKRSVPTLKKKKILKL